MGVIASAVNWAKAIAADASHGYSQMNRWGPDYDCSSFVISAFKQAGLALTSTYTGNMRADFLSHGFKDVTSRIVLATGYGLESGDVLLNERSHTAIYIGNGQIVQASHDELGGVTGRTSGDQTGGEIAVRSYYNFPWDYVLRYSETPSAHSTTSATSQKPASEIQNGSYTVKSGDTLWGIAEKFLGNGSLYYEIVKYNGLTSTALKPGQVLRIPDLTMNVPTPITPKPMTPHTSGTIAVNLPSVKYGDTGIVVRKIQELLVVAGYKLVVDGDYGTETKEKVSALQSAKGIAINGNVDNARTWEALLS